MSTNYLYFKVSGGVVLEAIQKFNALRAEQNEAILNLVKEFGADSAYCESLGVVALEYKNAPDKVPAGWILRGNKHFVPNRRTKEGKAVFARFSACKSSTWWTFHEKFMSFTPFTFMRAMVCHAVKFEKVGDTFVLLVPDMGMHDVNATEIDLQDSGGPAWTPPDEHTTRLKTSEYWLLKEAVPNSVRAAT